MLGKHSSRRRSSVPLLVAAALASLVVAACGDSEGSDGGDDGKVGLKVGVLVTSGSPRHIAMDQSGAFADMEHPIEIVDFASSKDALEALTAGAIDVGLHLQSPATIVAQGNADPAWTKDTRPFAVVAFLAIPGSIGNKVMVLADSPADSVADLAGAKIGVSKGGMSHFFLLLAARSAGLTDFEPVYMPPSDLGAALTSGAVDAIASGATALGLLTDGTARVIADSLDLYDEHEVVLAANSVLTDPDRSAALAELLDRNDRFNTWVEEHQDEVMTLQQADGVMSAEAAALATQRFWGRRVPAMLFLSDFQNEADLFLEAALLTQAVDVTVIVDDRFAPVT